MAKVKVVEALLFLVLLAGDFRHQSASIAEYYTPLVAANRENLLCATNAFVLDKRMTTAGTVLAAAMMIGLPRLRCSCDLGMPTGQALWTTVRKHSHRRAL